MERSRPDFPSYLTALDLPLDAGDLDILARSGGVSRGDRLVLTEEPTVEPDGTTICTFVVRGLRFALPDPAKREQVLASLGEGAARRSYRRRTAPTSRTSWRRPTCCSSTSAPARRT